MTEGRVEKLAGSGLKAPDHQVGRQLVDPAGAQWVATVVGEAQLSGTRAGALWGSAKLQLPVRRGPVSINLISTFVCRQDLLRF